MSDLNNRVLRAKNEFTRRTGMVADQLFLGPSEYHQFKENIHEMSHYAAADKSTHATFHGMTVIGLMSDGVRRGCTEADE